MYYTNNNFNFISKIFEAEPHVAAVSDSAFSESGLVKDAQGKKINSKVCRM